MARPSVAARNLSLTEELEKIEQSITLTLQEIDHNFSKAHRIVTSSILPIVEQYGEHSRTVWDASKFWKQFFEASANVSLSGYEELANDDETTVMEESTAMRDEPADETTDHHGEEPASTPGRDQLGGDGMTEELTLDGAELTGSTPRPNAKSARAQMSPMDSPYEAMRREMKVEEEGQTTVLEDEDSSILFAQQTARLPDMTMTPQALLQQRNRGDQSSTQKNKDPLLHRILDKNYRLQATPHKSAMAATPLKGKDNKTAAWDDSPMSSPDMAVPTLRTEAFLSPYKNRAARERFTAASQGPRTPGISVQTPMAAKKMIREALAQNTDGGNSAGGSKPKYEIDWDSDEDDDADLYGGMSPPKTIQFALPPSKLLQTPAREASKRIVDDILTNAGAGPDSSEYSPTLVRMNKPTDDSF